MYAPTLFLLLICDQFASSFWLDVQGSFFEIEFSDDHEPFPIFYVCYSCVDTVYTTNKAILQLTVQVQKFQQTEPTHTITVNVVAI